MRFLHLSDLHLGKRISEVSMLDDQAYILDQILNIIDSNAADAVLISGDVYDKLVPPGEAVRLFDSFLTAVSNMDKHVFIISGNHDSAERLSFGAKIMENSKIHIFSVFEGRPHAVKIDDGFGEINIYMLPFVKPSNVRGFFPDKAIDTYNDALRAVIGELNINRSSRNILLAHQFVTGALRSESEEISVGGLDNVDADIFKDFDYAALGHIHRPQSVLEEKIRYCGTPLKYSFSEANHKKTVTLVDMGKKGETFIKEIPLYPKRDMRQIKGKYGELTLRENYKDTKTDDYLHVTLTDEQDIPDAAGRLSAIYPNILRLDYENSRTKVLGEISSPKGKEKLPMELFGEFYSLQNNQDLNAEQEKLVRDMINEIWGTGK